MLRPHPKLTFILFTWLIASCGARIEQEDKVKEIEHLMDSLDKAKIFNGAIVIAKNDSILFSRGYGYANFADSIPFTVHTLADGGSLTKTFTAFVLRLLHERGKIDLNRPVQDYLAQYPYPNTSVQDLITHNAGGLPGYSFFFSKIGDSIILTNELMLSLLNKHRPELSDSAKTGFNYENCGMDLAALVIEKVTGKRFDLVLKEIFFDRLRMNATIIRPSRRSDMNPKRAVGYYWRNDSLMPNDIDDREGFYGASNLHFTTSDLCKLGQAFCHDTFYTRLIREYSKPAIVAGKVSGLNQLNWYYTESKNARYYWGNVAGFYSHLYYDPTRNFTIAFMTNTTMPPHWRQPFATALVEIMESGTYDRDKFRIPDYIKLDEQQNRGYYKAANGDSITLFHANSQLQIRRNGGLRYPLYIIAPTLAYAPGLDVWIGLSKKDNTTILHWNTIFYQDEAVLQ